MVRCMSVVHAVARARVGSKPHHITRRMTFSRREIETVLSTALTPIYRGGRWFESTAAHHRFRVQTDAVTVLTPRTLESPSLTLRKLSGETQLPCRGTFSTLRNTLPSWARRLRNSHRTESSIGMGRVGYQRIPCLQPAIRLPVATVTLLTQGSRMADC